MARQREPSGVYATTGVAALRGAGITGGVVRARDFFVSEVNLLSDLLPVLDPSRGKRQVVLALGVAVRVFGFERIIGGAAYRGYDIDVGFRVGPGLSFSTRETKASRNTRFSLLVEPYVRYSRKMSPGRIWFFEAGSIRPHFRAGIWFPV